MCIRDSLVLFLLLNELLLFKVQLSFLSVNQLPFLQKLETFDLDFVSDLIYMSLSLIEGRLNHNLDLLG